MDKNKVQLQRLKKSAVVGLIASTLILVFRFCIINTGNVARVGTSLVCTAIVVFILKVVCDIAVEKSKFPNKKLVNAIFIVFAFAAFLSVTLYTYAPVLLFPNVQYDSAKKALEKYDDTVIEKISIKTQEGVISGRFWHNESAPQKAPVVLYFGANGEDSSYRFNELIRNKQESDIFEGCNFAFVDYPGYGDSEGESSEKNFKSMGLAAYDNMMSRDDVSSVIVMGYSIGTGVANYVTSMRQPMGLILMAPYANGYDLYNSYLNIFHGPMKALVSFKMKSEKFASDVTVKPLILASKTDEVVSYESSVELFKEYPSGCNFVTLDDLNHNYFWKNDEVRMEIKKYISGLR